MLKFAFSTRFNVRQTPFGKKSIALYLDTWSVVEIGFRAFVCSHLTHRKPLQGFFLIQESASIISGYLLRHKTLSEPCDCNKSLCYQRWRLNVIKEVSLAA